MIDVSDFRGIRTAKSKKFPPDFGLIAYLKETLRLYSKNIWSKIFGLHQLIKKK